jgi:hypothetical protein
MWHDQQCRACDTVSSADQAVFSCSPLLASTIVSLAEQISCCLLYTACSYCYAPVCLRPPLPYHVLFCLARPCPSLLLPAVRVPLYPFAAPVRDYSEMARRYTHMFVNPDVVKVVFAWAQVREHWGSQHVVWAMLVCSVPTVGAYEVSSWSWRLWEWKDQVAVQCTRVLIKVPCKVLQQLTQPGYVLSPAVLCCAVLCCAVSWCAVG